jgi:hypothetical protein
MLWTGYIKPIQLPTQLHDDELFEGTTATAVSFKAKGTKLNGKSKNFD